MKKAITILFCASLVVGAFGYSALNKTTSPATAAPQSETIIQPDTVVVHGSIAAKTKTELVGESEVIVRGKVKEILPSKWSNPNGELGSDARNVIQTDILVHVEKTFKGTPYDKQIAVRIDKGQVGNMTWRSEGYPDFTPGEDVILFLRKDDSDVAKPHEKYYVLTGMFQGKFNQDPKHPEDKRFMNGKDAIEPDTLTTEIQQEELDYKKLSKNSVTPTSDGNI